MAEAEKPQSSLIELKIDPKTNLNPKYLFNSFIVGSSNELAYRYAQAVVKDVGKKYNPLFVYGGVGLGKTHLIQAMGNEIANIYKGSVNVLYTSSEKFINDVVWAIRNKRMDDVKKGIGMWMCLLSTISNLLPGSRRPNRNFFIPSIRFTKTTNR